MAFTTTNQVGGKMDQEVYTTENEARIIFDNMVNLWFPIMQLNKTGQRANLIPPNIGTPRIHRQAKHKRTSTRWDHPEEDE